MNNGQFQVSVGEFTGPLDLLLTLIEERKMLISDVSLSKVADDFVTFVQSQSSFPAGQTAQFILVSATLLLIKSRALLPVFTLTDEEEEDVHDLEKRLNLYKVFRNAARGLGRLSNRLYFGGLKRDTEPVFAPAPDMSMKNLHAAMLDTIKRVPKKETRPDVEVRSVVSLDEMMERLSKRIERALSFTFNEFVGSPEDKREIVVGFLAMLELVKRGMVLADQDAHFSDINMQYQGASQPPRYD